MNIALSAVHVLVDDHDAALGFDHDALGLRVRSDAVRDGSRRVSLVPDRQPDLRIVLGQPHEGRSQEDGDTLAALLANGELLPIHLRSDDLNSIFERIAIAPDIDVLHEPISHPWGTRDIAVLDPAGNVVRIEQGSTGPLQHTSWTRAAATVPTGKAATPPAHHEHDSRVSRRDDHWRVP